MTTFKASSQQTAFFDWIANGTGSAVLRAGAGCGKSTTLIQGLSRMQGPVLLVAYNREIANELKTKAAALREARAEAGLPLNGLDRPFISTVHGACYSAWRRVAPNARVDENKVRNMVDDAAQRGEIQDFEKTFIVKLVSLAKQLLLPIPAADVNAWYEAVDHYSLDSELPDVDGAQLLRDAVEKARRFHVASRALCYEVIDFDDMIYAPLTYNARFFQNDWVIVDEAQDTNPARRMACAKMLKRTGRLVAVGDDRQAIYGFTGASANSLDLIIEQHNAIVLPLSVTYRCPKAVVAYAHQWVPVDHLMAHESAPEGVVRPVLEAADREDSRPWFLRDAPGKNAAVLCRFNKPLVATAYAMLREGVACKVEGRDIGNGLIQLARRWKVKTIDALETRLEGFRTREIRKARAKKSETLEQAANDKVDTLMIFVARCRAEGSTTIDCVVAEIEALFADGVKGVTVLCSKHKSKGREWPRVYILEAKGGKRELKGWEQVQEANLNYVGVTRAQSELILVPEGA